MIFLREILKTWRRKHVVGKLVEASKEHCHRNGHQSSGERGSRALN